MDLRHLLPFVAFTSACTAGKVEVADDDSAGGPGTGTPSDTNTYEPECRDPGASVCGNEASIIRGAVRLADGLQAANTSGTLFIALNHELYDGGFGGGYHTHVEVNAVDLAAGPVPFELDMCAGAAMWSEENCTFSLVAVLDGNGNTNLHHMQPDEGEPSTRVGNLFVSCTGESPCLDVVLDCVDGDTCVSFAELGTCACADEECPSDFALCSG